MDKILTDVVILEKGIIPPNALFENINPVLNAGFYKAEVRAETPIRVIHDSLRINRYQKETLNGLAQGFVVYLSIPLDSAAQTHTSYLMMRSTICKIEA